MPRINMAALRICIFGVKDIIAPQTSSGIYKIMYERLILNLSNINSAINVPVKVPAVRKENRAPISTAETPK
ncbi:hypothetical protein SS31_23250 [Pluralibacter gergoviae]|nr:hypothetical protein SS31_23250 [Pluralibacter gergoviae]